MIKKMLGKTDPDGTKTVISILDDFNRKKEGLKGAIDKMNSSLENNLNAIALKKEEYENYKKNVEEHSEHLNVHRGMAERAIKQLNLLLGFEDE